MLKTFVNASYNYEDGLIPNNSFKRTAIRSNTDVKLTEWLRAGLNLNIRRSIQKDPTSGTNNIIIVRCVLHLFWAVIMMELGEMAKWYQSVSASD